jgi:hypothetical protein
MPIHSFCFINEFASCNNYYSDISIEEFVSNNSIEVNKKLICDISGDIFNAINLYRTHIGEIDHLRKSFINNSHIFLFLLSFIQRLRLSILNLMKSILSMSLLKNTRNILNVMIMRAIY